MYLQGYGTQNSIFCVEHDCLTDSAGVDVLECTFQPVKAVTVFLECHFLLHRASQQCAWDHDSGVVLVCICSMAAWVCEVGLCEVSF